MEQWFPVPTHELDSASRELEYGHSAKAIPHRCHTSVDLRMRCQDVDSRLRSPAEPTRIIAQFDDTRHYALTIARNTIAVHVGSKHYKAELRQTLFAVGVDSPGF
jgi:hypothetical protein